MQPIIINIRVLNKMKNSVKDTGRVRGLKAFSIFTTRM